MVVLADLADQSLITQDQLVLGIKELAEARGGQLRRTNVTATTAFINNYCRNNAFATLREATVQAVTELRNRSR